MCTNCRYLLPTCCYAIASSCLLVSICLLSGCLVYMQSVPEASGAKAKVQAPMAPMQPASTAKQPPKGHSAADAAAAIASGTTDNEVQVRKVASVPVLYA